MPKERKASLSGYLPVTAPYPVTTTSSAATRNATIWNSADDETLLQARASGLNWGPIHQRHFPNKTANACRKRHERLIEKRQGEDWDVAKLELLANEYAAVRKEMWEPLAARLGEKWTLVEAKCMEKGLKNLLAAARSAHKRNDSGNQNGLIEEQGTDHHSDSGIGLGSDAEMEVDEAEPSGEKLKHPTWPNHAESAAQQQPPSHQDHIRSRSLPQPLPPLPLYRPPPPPLNLNTQRRVYDLEEPMTTSPATMSYIRHSASQRNSPESQNGKGGMSIQSVLSPAPQCV